MSRCWAGVASLDHVLKGVDGGFCQLCHGKRMPVERLRPGDWIVYYSPRTHMREGDPVQAFTAIGRIREGSAYQVDMGEDFVPTRRDVDFISEVRPAPIAPLLSSLSFSKDRPRSWGQVLRRGVFEIEPSDLALIARSMGVKYAI